MNPRVELALMPHRQIMAKVNVPIDRGIAPVIEALSLWPELQTIESCEGDVDNPAWVCFYYGQSGANSWLGVSEFVLGFLAPGLARMIGDSAHVVVRLNGCGIAQGELMIRPGTISDVTNALTTLYRNWECSGGRSGT